MVASCAARRTLLPAVMITAIVGQRTAKIQSLIAAVMRDPERGHLGFLSAALEQALAQAC